MKTKMQYAKNWLDKATEANNAAEILNNAGRIDEAKRLLLVSKYCYRRYENAMRMEVLKRYSTPLFDRAMFYLGALTAIAFISLLIYCFYKANF